MASITCGNCGDRHHSVQEVRYCYGRTDQATTPVQSSTEPAATGPQVELIRKLRIERGINHNEPIPGGSTKFAASNYIKELLASKPAKTEASVELKDGIYYRVDESSGTYFKVYHTIHGANVQVAKRLVIEEPDCGDCANGNPCELKCAWTYSWEYEGKRPLYTLTPDNMLSEEDARKFGLIYGFCVFGHKLNREESLHVGYGKTCAANNGWWYPTKAELKALQASGPVDA